MPTSAITSINRPAPTAETKGRNPRDRLTWIVPLMSRFATEKLDHHDSPKFA